MAPTLEVRLDKVGPHATCNYYEEIKHLERTYRANWPDRRRYWLARSRARVQSTSAGRERRARVHGSNRSWSQFRLHRVHARVRNLMNEL